MHLHTEHAAMEIARDLRLRSGLLQTKFGSGVRISIRFGLYDGGSLAAIAIRYRDSRWRGKPQIQQALHWISYKSVGQQR